MHKPRLIYVSHLSVYILSLIFLLAATANAASLPNGRSSNRVIHNIKISKRKREFIAFMVPKMQQANRQVLDDRTTLLKLHQLWLQHKTLDEEQLGWLHAMANKYRVRGFLRSEPAAWQRLLMRVDAVPVSMMLAQAANESAWGRSRFAKQGHNYFGKWCYKAGCGIVPKRRSKGAKYEVKSYPTVLASVIDYMHNLNTHGTYKHFRQMRAALRKQNKQLRGMQLAGGLGNYSQRGKAYIHSIQQLISSNGFNQYDTIDVS